MRQTVEVNGITLTRTQVENAMKQLNEPEGWPHLTPVIEVCGHKRRGVVIVHKEMHNIIAAAKGLGSLCPEVVYTLASEIPRYPLNYIVGVLYENGSSNAYVNWTQFQNDHRRLADPVLPIPSYK